MKICRWCNEEKSLTEFYAQNKKKADGTPYIYYNPECKKCTKESATKWRKQPENREKFLENRKRMNSKPKQKLLVKKRSRLHRETGEYLNWQQNNKDRIRSYNYLRQQHKSHNISKEEWLLCKEYFDNSCAYCGLHIEEHYNLFKGEMKWTDFHKDHVDHKGCNDITNCVPACKACNSSKHTSELKEWYNENNESFTQDRLNKIYVWLSKEVKTLNK